MKLRSIVIALAGVLLVCRAANAQSDPNAQQLAAEDEFNRKIDSKATERWTQLPGWISDVYISADGTPWFRGPEPRGSGSKFDDLFKAAVERAAAGQSQVLPTTIFLIDKAHRVFVQRGKAVAYYDPATKKWGQRYADGTEPSANKNPRVSDPGSAATFENRAWEDSTGSVWFVGGSGRLGWFIQRIDRNDNWTTWQIYAGQTIYSFPFSNPILVEQAGGAFVLCKDYTDDIPGHKEPVAMRFNGKEWSDLDPRVCVGSYHGITSIIPNHDGSITTICSGDKVWTYWPSEALEQSAGLIDKLIASLADPDPKIRESSHQRLALMGERAVDAMKKAADDAPPESQQRMKQLIADAAKFEADRHNNPHDDNLPYAGEWKYRMAQLCTRNDCGHVALYLQDVENIYTQQKSDVAIAVVQDDGSWDVHMGNREQWESTGWKSQPTNSFADSKGQVWLDQGTRRLDKDATMRVLPPAGLKLQLIYGEDRAGRVYFGPESGPICMLDESVAEGVSALEEKSFAALGPNSTPGDSVSTAISSERDALLSLNGGEPKPLATKFGGGPIISLVPMRNGGAILGGGDETSNEQWMFWDGTKGVSAPDMQPLVEQNAAAIAKIAARSFEDLDNVQFAGDDQGHLWFAHRYYRVSKPPARPSQKHLDQFRYFDGKTWHNVAAELNPNPKNIIGPCLPSHTVNNGRFALVMNGRNLVAVSYPNGVIHSEEVARAQNMGMVQPPTHFVDAPNGDTWASFGGNLLLIQDGKFEPQSVSLIPLMIDTDGQLWCTDNSNLGVKVDNSWITVAIAGVGNDTQMVQTPDKRIWALHKQAISQVELQKSGGAPVLKEVGRWAWGSPRSGFPGLVCDGSSYLWFGGNEKNCIRITLPKPTGAAEKPKS